MDIRKGISYVAFGFLFVLVNFNLTINGSSINIMPEFVGWILMFLAFDKLGQYAEKQSYLKWLALVLTILTGVIWVCSFVKPDLDIQIVKTIVSVAETVYMFLLFGILEKIAHDYAPSMENTIFMLKIVNLVLYVAFLVTAMLAVKNTEKFALIAFLVGTATLVSAIVTAVMLFRLRGEISE